MAAAKERSSGTTSNPYEGYGKFRKRPFGRSSHRTPYDRPQIPNGNKDGWLSKIVDPAHRLITSTAHKLFASVFRKRLPPPQQPKVNEEASNKRVETVLPSTVLSKDSLDARVAFSSGSDTPSTSYAKDGLSDLELMLKQKTFTRSEIARLTALLQSRTVNLDAGGEEKKSEAVPLKVLSSLDRKELTNTHGNNNQLISTPTVSSTVLDEDVASPAELAKAYMGSRSSKLSPPMLGSHSQVLGGDNAALVPFPSKSPMMSLVPKSSGHSAFPENGYVTPRSRGRSAIYSMARTPYSRVRLAANVQGHATRVDTFGGASSQSALDLENNRFSGSKQGALKRRSSVLDNDIGSAGPIRRIRQKSNLLPVSGSLAICGTGVATSQNLSSTKKLALSGESSRENVENNCHGSDLTTVPSKSSEVASKILQQLDVLVSSREKSPTKLSPSMLRGPALRSLENVDSSRFLDTVQDNEKPDVKNDISISNTPDSSFQKTDKEPNGPTKFISSDKSLAIAVSKNVLHSRSDATTAPISSTQLSAQKHSAFQMSAPEDMLEVDDDENIYAPKSTALTEREGKLDIPSNKTNATEVVTMEKTSVFPEISRAESSLVNQKTTGTSEAHVDTEKGSGSTFAKSPLSSITPQQEVKVNGLSTVKSDKAVGSKDSSSMRSVFTFGDQPVSEKQANGTLPTADFGLNATKSPWASSSPIVNEPAIKFVAKQKLESSSSFESFSTGATESVVKETESYRAGEKKSSKDRIVFMPLESVSAAGSTSSTGLFSFGTSANGSALNDRLLASAPVFSSVLQGSDNVTNKVSDPGSNAGAFANISSSVTSTLSMETTNTNSLSASAIAQSAIAPIFKFGSSVSSTSSLTESSIGVEKSESKTKEANNSGANAMPVGTPLPVANTGSSIFSGTSSAIAGPGSSLFGNSSSATMGSRSSIFSTSALPGTESSIFSFNAGTTTSVSTSQSEGFNPFTAGSVEASAPGTVLSTSSPSVITQFGSSSSGPSFGGSAASTSSSMFSSSSKPFSAGATFGLTSSTSFSDTSTVGSSSNTGSTLFSSSWQAPNSSVFGQTVGSSSTSITTPLFSFAASSASNAATSSAPVVFGSSSSASSASLTSTAATGSPFVFGSSSSAFGAPSTSNAASSSPVVFSSSSNAFGSSAPALSGSIFSFSSSTAATPSQPVFSASAPGFAFGAPASPSGINDQMSMEDSMAEDTVQATMPAVSAFNQQPASSPGFSFGTTPPSGLANPFGATTQSGANPFQFGGQSNMGFTTPQNPSPFQASSSLGGSFSLGTGGADKSGRRMVKVKKSQRKK